VAAHPWSVPAFPLGWKVRLKSDRERGDVVLDGELAHGLVESRQRGGQVGIERHLRRHWLEWVS